MCRRFAVARARPRHHLRRGHASDEALLGRGASQAPAPEARPWAAEAYLAAAAPSPASLNYTRLQTSHGIPYATLGVPEEPTLFPLPSLSRIFWDVVGGVFSAAGLSRGFSQLSGHPVFIFVIHLLFLIDALYTRSLRLMTAPAHARVRALARACARPPGFPAPLIAGNLGPLCFTCRYPLRVCVKHC